MGFLALCTRIPTTIFGAMNKETSQGTPNNYLLVIASTFENTREENMSPPDN
jgi:hypothetical protein